MWNLWHYNLHIKAFVQMTVLRGSRPSRLSIYIEIQYLYSVRAQYSIRFCHRQICRELKFPPFRGIICNILDWIPAPFGKSRRLFSTNLRFTEPKTCLHIGKMRTPHPHHQINTFSCEPVYRDARARYNRLHNDLVVQPSHFTTMCKMRVKASMILDKNWYKHRRAWIICLWRSQHWQYFFSPSSLFRSLPIRPCPSISLYYSHSLFPSLNELTFPLHASRITTYFVHVTFYDRFRYTNVSQFCCAYISVTAISCLLADD